MKRCTKCDMEKDESEFGLCSKGKNGLKASCKDCERAYATERNRANGYAPQKYINKNVTELTGYKKCTNCGVTKDINEFCKQRRATDGLNPWCRLCFSRNYIGKARNRGIKSAGHKGYTAYLTGFKKCPLCTLTLLTSEFNHSIRSGWKYACKKCLERRAFELRIKRSYNMSVEEYAHLINDQNFKCKICGIPIVISVNGTAKERWGYVDHCHVTLKNRSILCLKCNTGIGSFNDDTELLLKAIAYLAEHTERLP